ncbi:hypothetical protein ACR56H_11745 [Micrococcus luteus]|uniref:hypothetical protein n=1 Tax=Micrococcus luteus TaxID=1270 RepID=UPI003DA151A8
MVLATLDRQDPGYLYVALVAATAPCRMEAVDFHTGTFPHGLSWKATEEAETVLNAAVAMGPREAAAGALAVLAYVSWLRDEGSLTDDRLALAKACAPGHAHARAVTAMIGAASVAAVAPDPALAWKPIKGRPKRPGGRSPAAPAVSRTRRHGPVRCTLRTAHRTGRAHTPA